MLFYFNIKRRNSFLFRQVECASNYRLLLGNFIYMGLQKGNIQRYVELVELTYARFKLDRLQQFGIPVLYQNRLQNLQTSVE